MSIISTNIDRIIFIFLKIYYIIKVKLYNVIIGRHSLSEVLYHSLRPEIVLKLYGAKIGKRNSIYRYFDYMLQKRISLILPSAMMYTLD
jgi:hypothetical protein